MSLTICLHSWQSMSNKFYTYPTEFWCSRPENLANISVEEWQNLSRSPDVKQQKKEICF